MTPIAAVINEIYKQQPDIEVSFVCDGAFAQQAERVMGDLPIEVATTVITAGKFRRYAHFRYVDYLTTPSVVFQNIIDVFRVVKGCMQSIGLLRRIRPEVVFAKGGYVCLPVGLAARFLGIPLVIHDSDARPGLTNRILARYAVAIGTGFPIKNYPYDPAITHHVGVPVREEFKPVTDSGIKAAKKRLAIKESSHLVVAIGGGLGAKSINSAMIHAAPKLLEKGVEMRVIAGALDVERVKLATAQYEPHFQSYGFITGENFMDLLVSADIVVTRASATTIQELAALKKTIIAVPSRALGDQIKNAAVLESENAALVLDDDQLDGGELTATIASLLAQDHVSYSTALNALARTDAAYDTAALIISAAKEA